LRDDCARAFARQPTAATLSGRVTDPNGAVVTGARIIATEKAKGIKRETVSSDEGVFALANRPAARCRRGD
jgi:hypothetical protein